MKGSKPRYLNDCCNYTSRVLLSVQLCCKRNDECFTFVCQPRGSLYKTLIKKSTIKTIALVVGIPTLYAMLLRLFFGWETFDDFFVVMSVSFLFLMPSIMGLLTVYFSSAEKARELSYRIFAPWLPIFIFLFLTLALAWEGWACWLMILPLFLIAASVGGLIGGYLKVRKKNKVRISLIALLPFFVAPIENMIGAVPATYEAYTSIDIHASADKIWKNVVRVSEIPKEKDKGWLTKLLGFPRPVKAELTETGVGAYREAIFTGGLVFHETVTEYIDKKKMVFSITANPHEIPSTTLDEHIVLGGKYFDVLNGVYELEELGENFYRLHLYSYFELNTTFNFYASRWAKWIMKDIQKNILQVEKYRAERH